MMRATSLGHAGILIETDARLDRVRSVVRPGVLRLVVPVPAQRPARRRPAGADRGRRLPLRLAPPRRPLRRAVAARPPAAATSASCCPATRPASSSGGCGRSGSPNLIRTVDGEELDLGGLTRRDPRRDVDHRRPRRRLGARRQRRRRPRIVNQNDCRTTDLDALRRPRPGRPPLAAVQRGDLVPDGLRAARRRAARRSSTPRSTASSPGRCATSRRSTPGRSCRAPGRRASSTPSCSTSTSSTATSRASSSTSARSSTGSPTSGHRGILAIPGTTIEVDAGRRSPSPTRSPTTRSTRSSTDKGAYLRALPGRLDAVARRAARPAWPTTPTTDLVADAAGVVGAAAGDGADACATAIGAACLLRAGDVEILVDFPAGEVRAVRRRAVRLPLRHRPRARRDGRRRAGRRLEQLAVPVVPLPGVARRASSTSTSTTSSSRCRPSGCGAPRPRRVRKLRPADRDRARHRARRLGHPAPLPAPQRRPRRVRRGRRLRADVHAARLALRPRDRPLPHRRRPPDPRPPPRPTSELADAGRTATQVRTRRSRQTGGVPWTQTGMPIGIRSVSQMKSIAGTVTRTQPCEAG